MSLLSSRRFLPLFITQFFGAFNDNLLKNSLVMLVTYRLSAQTGGNAQLLVTLAAGLFMLPFFLFSATAGQLADKYDRAKLSRIVKLVEIALMVIAAVGFFAHSPYFLLFVLFCMGVQATFFGPIKYALLPQHLHDDELLLGNAYIESGTFLAILLGTIIGGLLILQPGGEGWVSAAMVLFAVLGYLASRFIPGAPAPDPTLTVNRNIWRETWRIVGFSRENKAVFICILGISWFWLVGATFLSQFPGYAKDVIHSDETVVTLFLTVFSVGIGVGSMLCSKLLGGHIRTTYVPLAALGMTLFSFDIYIASLHPSQGDSAALIDAWHFMTSWNSWRIMGDLFLIAVSGGVYIVPLYAIMQHQSAPQHRARIIAANNVINALFMVAAAVLTLAMLAMAFTIPQVFLAVALANGVVAVVCYKVNRQTSSCA